MICSICCDLLGPAEGQEPIRFIAIILCPKRGAMCRKRLIFLRNSLYEHVKYNVLGRQVN